jgi:FKBP-type peptidyl-prolyl cis-trans isomerase FkpA
MKPIYLMSFVFLFISCNSTQEEKPKFEWNQKKSTAFHKELAIQQELQIKMYLEQHRELSMVSSGSGLRYYIYEHGEGDSAKVGMTARVETEITLLDGTLCYKTEKDEVEEFVIDKSDVESGIQEGIKKMREGDRAKMVIPSHLAHGLVGDLAKIPPMAVIIVDIHLIELF